MPLELMRIPQDRIRGIYPQPNGILLGERQRRMHPAAAKALHDAGLLDDVVYSDVFRSVAESASARAAKGAMVASPGKSRHNYGLAVDVALERTYAMGRIKDHADLVKRMGDAGWVTIPKEPWHFQYDPIDPFALYGLEMRQPKVRARLVERLAGVFSIHPVDPAKVLSRVSERYFGRTNVAANDLWRVCWLLAAPVNDLPWGFGK